MTETIVKQLLKENEVQRLSERRLANRTPFVRPILICPLNGPEKHGGFTRDISKLGIGVISPVKWEVGSFVDLSIHSMNGRPVRMRAETRWCDNYGHGWYVVGFIFR